MDERIHAILVCIARAIADDLYIAESNAPRVTHLYHPGAAPDKFGDAVDLDVPGIGTSKPLSPQVLRPRTV